MPHVTDGRPTGPRPGEARRFQRWRRTERTMLLVRWGAVLFGVVQVLTYYRPYPPGFYFPLALGLVGLLAVGNAALGLGVRRVRTHAQARQLALAALVFDTTIVLGFVFVYTFDVDTAIWALIYVLPLEGAIRFQRNGALAVMAVATVVYSLREIFGTVVYGNDLLLTSISFRMGIGFLIATVAGVMASHLVRDRDELAVAKQSVEDYAAEVASVNNELQKAAQLKDDFLAMANHELRTPLTAVVGYASTLVERWDEVPDALRREFVESIRHQAGRLQILVEDLLTLSSLQAGALALKIEVVEVVDVASEAIRTTAGPADRIANHCPPGLTVLADPQRLCQILMNYLSNALRYGAEPVTVEAAHAGDTVEIRVRDAGAGVPEDFVPRLFEKFTRAHTHPGETGWDAGGTGLGLAIVRLLAEAQSGRVWYETGSSAGAVFCVRLPAGSGLRQAAPTTPEDQADLPSFGAP